LKLKILSTALLLLVLVAGCTDRGKQEKGTATTGSAQTPREFKLDGEIVSVNKDGKSAVIKHKTIEGFMEAMTMSYPMPETSDLEKVHAGDHITATVYHDASSNRIWVGNVQVQK